LFVEKDFVIVVDLCSFFLPSSLLFFPFFFLSMASTPVAPKNWNTIYPVYLNSKKTVAQGRRIPLDKAVDAPTVNEIYEVCKYLGYECVLEPNKAYSRDFTQRGRIKLRLWTDSGDPAVSGINSSK
jgi:signal recognition particle subunit SRP19